MISVLSATIVLVVFVIPAALLLKRRNKKGSRVSIAEVVGIHELCDYTGDYKFPYRIRHHLAQCA